MNVFQYATIVEKNWKMNLGDLTDYRPKYTFYADFAIAEFCEVYMRNRNAVRKTYKEVISSWGKNIEAITEIVMVLNHKSWAFDGKVDSKYLGIGDTKADEFAHLYVELYEDARSVVEKNFKDDEDAMSYYYQITD